ncbi:MAG: hypothetical protein I8H77_13865 [Comamonadaceae bacterium]|nr:hypothetical protein [Comamonadaceae bacterium]
MPTCNELRGWYHHLHDGGRPQEETWWRLCARLVLPARYRHCDRGGGLALRQAGQLICRTRAAGGSVPEGDAGAWVGLAVRGLFKTYKETA